VAEEEDDEIQRGATVAYSNNKRQFKFERI
jgi:hypothetical protein